MREVGGWIHEDNLSRVVEYIAALVHHEWDDLDDGALEAGIPSTDADLPPGAWIARDHEGGILSMTISGDVDAVLAARFETLLDLH
jgi:hypothetical protein